MHRERVHDQRDLANLSPPYVVSLEELTDEVEQRAENDVVHLGRRCRLHIVDGDDDVAQMARRGWEGGPGRDDGAVVNQAVELVRDILLGGALTGDGVAHFVSDLPVGV